MLGGSADASYLDSELQASIQSRQAQINDLDKELGEKQQATQMGLYYHYHHFIFLL